MEFVASFSGGKDSTLAIKRMIDNGHRIIAIIVSKKKDLDESWTHGLSKKFFKEAAEVLRCDLIEVSTNVEDYEKNFENGLKSAKEIGAQACVFGDIDINIHLKWNKDRCKNAGLQCIHPLMFEDRNSICREFISSGLNAKIVKVDEKKLPKDFLGKNYNEDFLKLLDEFKGVDKCGENGEFHTSIDIDSMQKVFCKGIYVDNASTCFPKAPGVSTAMEKFIDNKSFSINRGTYMNSYRLSSDIIDVRDKFLKFFNAPRNYQCVFVPSATEGINMVLRGLLSEGENLIVDERLHNSSWRTIEFLKNRDVDIFNIGGEMHRGFDTEGKESGEINIDRSNMNNAFDYIKSKINNKTKAVFVTLVDNITGKYLTEVESIANLCFEKDIYFIVDAVQAVCEVEVDIEKLKADVLIVSSHIGMMGPEGIASVIMSEKASKNIKSLIFGGTGSQSNSPNMPTTLPDKFEAGTMNHSGIIGCAKALEYIERVGLENVIERKRFLGQKLRDELQKIEGIKVKGYGSFCSMTVEGEDDSMVSFNMDLNDGIMTRVGIQCSPCTHMSEGSFPNGSIRMSVGYFNSERDVEQIIKSLRKILNNN